MRQLLAHHRLQTVCQGAQCPNAAECWSASTATFMLLGSMCTRNCRFCDIPTGNPGGMIDLEEPDRLAAAVCELELAHVVLTSVDRDDLSDGGAAAFACVIERIAAGTAAVTIEALIPDFGGASASLDYILATNVDIIGHNLETVRRLTPALRDVRAGYEQSIDVLGYLADHAGSRRIKSGLIVGLGESVAEIHQAMENLRTAGVDMLTIGQYLQPNNDAVPVARYLPPCEFEQFASYARELGFKSVEAGPLVRSSYHAAAAYSKT